MDPRRAHIAETFNRWLTRFAPPRRLVTDEARQDEANALLRRLDRLAPSSGYEKWLGWLLDDLSVRDFTSWPSEGDLVKSASEINRRTATSHQQPKERPQRSAEDLRAARFRGETLTYRESKIALTAPMSPEEWDHHLTILAGLTGMSVVDLDRFERRLHAESADSRPPERKTRLVIEAEAAGAMG